MQLDTDNDCENLAIIAAHSNVATADSEPFVVNDD